MDPIRNMNNTGKNVSKVKLIFLTATVVLIILSLLAVINIRSVQQYLNSSEETIPDKILNNNILLLIAFLSFSTLTLLYAYIKLIKEKNKSTGLRESLDVNDSLLKENEERYHLMVEEVTDYAIILIDTKGIILNWNKGAEKIKGYTAKEIIGTNFSVFYTDEDKKNNLPQILIDKAGKEGRAIHEGWRLRKDGTRFWGSITITALRNTKGILVGFTKVTRDLTDLKESEDRYHRMVDEVADYAIIFLNTEGRIENWNKGAESIKGYSASEIIGQSFEIFYSQEDKDNRLPQTLIERARIEGRAVHEGWRFRKDGSRFWGSIAITALHNNKGEVFGFTKVTRDLTEKKTAEENIKQQAEILRKKNIELENMNKELQSFAYVSSHDLQEPLRKIQTFSDRILETESEALSERGLDYFKRMRAASKRMQILIDDLLQYAHTSTSDVSLEKVALKTVIEKLKNDLKEEIETKNAKIIIITECELNVIPFQFYQLMHNLVSNALKFTRNGMLPKIEISCKVEKGITLMKTLNPESLYTHITVRDNGIGFEDQYKEKIFEIFKRLHGKAEFNGTGIGLAICKKIVENHDGIITANGQLNEGATFDIYLPAA